MLLKISFTCLARNDRLRPALPRLRLGDELLAASRGARGKLLAAKNDRERRLLRLIGKTVAVAQLSQHHAAFPLNYRGLKGHSIAEIAQQPQSLVDERLSVVPEIEPISGIVERRDGVYVAAILNAEALKQRDHVIGFEVF